MNSDDDLIRLCLETAQAYRLSDPFDRETLKRFLSRAMKLAKAEGEVTAEDAFRLLKEADVTTFRDFEAERYLGIPMEENLDVQ